jgi:hypothetical protein
MGNVSIAMKIGSPFSSVKLVSDTFESIKSNIGTKNYQVLISLGLNIPINLKNWVVLYCEKNLEFKVFQMTENSWASFINKAIDLSMDYRYFIKSHDDIILLTPNFYEVLKDELDKINQEVGWVSFTDIGWKFGDFSPSTRPGFYIDHLYEKCWENKTIFQFHYFPKNWTRNKNPIMHYGHKILKMATKKNISYPKPIKTISNYNLDMPIAPVICHAPFNHFVLIKMEVLQQIGKCEDWGTKNALLVDEDWGLRAAKLELPNIWIPSIEYFHNRGNQEGGSTRSITEIRKNESLVHKYFLNKWGFSNFPSKDEQYILRKNHKNNYISWSLDRKSYEWDYI